MKKSIVKHIALGVLASAILTACGGGKSSDTGGKQVCDFTLQGANPLEINLGQSYIEPGFIIKDGNNNVIQGTTTGVVNAATAGDYILTYGAESCSNTATRTVTVLPATAGTCDFKLNGANPLTMTVGSNYQELGVTITDANHKKVTGTIAGTVNKDKVGEYSLTYQSESCTNKITRIVKVVPADCVYTVKGANPLLVDQGDDLNDPGVSAIDINNQDVDITVSGTVDTSALGDYKLTYQGEGCANHVTRTVTVKLQTCAITLNGNSPLEVIVNGTYTDPGAKIKDKSGNVLGADVKGTGSVDETKVGEYVLTYGNEACANTSDRIVKVREPLTHDELKDLYGDVILP